jgi:putative ABC transport system ATP-binding protein
MIRLQGVSKAYLIGEVPLPVLKGISLTVAAGEFIAIMGPSGSGKSTLLNIIGCLDTVDQGEYYLLDNEVSSLNDDQLARLRSRHIGFVFQLFNLIPRVDAERNVELPLIYQRIRKPERLRRANAVLQQVGLADRARHSPAKLSGGQQQRVAIARALVNNPDLLIADEPTGSLDSRVGQEVMGIFKRLHELGKTIVMVTHEDSVARHAHRVVELRDGVIERDDAWN